MNASLDRERSGRRHLRRVHVHDLDGGELEDGDSVQIQVFNGLYLTIVPGSLGVLANKRLPNEAETFTVHLLSGDRIVADGSTIAIHSSDGARYLTDGVDAKLDATGTTVGVAQTFTVAVH